MKEAQTNHQHTKHQIKILRKIINIQNETERLFFGFFVSRVWLKTLFYETCQDEMYFWWIFLSLENRFCSNFRVLNVLSIVSRKIHHSWEFLTRLFQHISNMEEVLRKTLLLATLYKLHFPPNPAIKKTKNNF